MHGTFIGSHRLLGAVGLARRPTVTVDLDTRAATRHVRVAATGVDLVLAGQTLHGDVVIEQSTTATGQSVVTVAVVNTLADPSNLLTLTTGSTTILAIGAATGILVIGPTGVAGSLDVQDFTLTLGAGITLTASSITVEVNTGRTAVSQTVTVGGTTVALSLPAGPSVSVALLGGAALPRQPTDPQLAGSFALRQGTAADGTHGHRGRGHRRRRRRHGRRRRCPPRRRRGRLRPPAQGCRRLPHRQGHDRRGPRRRRCRHPAAGQHHAPARSTPRSTSAGAPSR